ncbi:hypothetical protein DACRYDRAFT_105101 [Dacryopinax primogenitus]|uniref:Uncharacterized protein n=1 Tax=Dacryopinax primogenitus (strain DJM 731) TaxID=1858805 RepID=M5GCS4_DACPD|nr:uncharacterized protein DACRYDRAFT_105101 [Dacryopinax primogenitus]EJU04032.1 hypothetical protein DACRYDRAFT_105101 [Dacryopinax primogenitus]
MPPLTEPCSQNLFMTALAEMEMNPGQTPAFMTNFGSLFYETAMWMVKSQGEISAAWVNPDRTSAHTCPPSPLPQADR